MQQVSLHFGAVPRKIAALAVSPSARTGRRIFLFSMSYFAAYLYGNSLPVPAPLWPPDAVLLATLLLTSPRRWWVYVAVTIPIRLVPVLAPGVPFWLLLLNLLNDTVKALLAAGLIYYFARGRPLLATLRGCVLYTACAVLAAPLLSACVGAAGRAALGAAYWLAWETWFLGDALASLVLVPTILLWANLWTSAGGLKSLRPSSPWRAGEALALGGAIVAVTTWVIVLSPSQGPLAHQLYLIVPILLWATVRFGSSGIASALTLVTLLAMTELAGAQGTFTLRSSTADVLALQFFLLTIGGPFLFLSALMEERAATESKLRASEARYETVVETQTEMITRYRPDTTLTFVNDATCRYWGKSREEVLGMPFLATLPEAAATRVQEMIQTLLAQPDPGIVTLEHEARFQDGSLGWQQWVNRTILDDAGLVIELQGIGRDITDRKHAEEALRANEARYRQVVRNLPRSAVLLFDDELRHSFADGPGLQLLGLTPEGLEGRTVWEAFPSDLATALAPAYEAAATGQAIYRIQVVPMPDASPTVLAASVLDRTTSPVGMVVLRDITEQRRARDELVRERTLTAMLAARSQEFRTLAEHSPDLIARLDPRGRFVYVNQAGAEMFGLAAEHWVGKTVDELGAPQDVSARWAQVLQDVVVTRAPQTFDAEVHLPQGQGQSQGEVRSLHVRCMPEFADDGDQIVSLLGIATDVSALKHAEARLAEQASEHEAIFEAQADGVGVYDLQARFVRANTALRDLLGLDVDAEYPSLPLEERAQRLLLFDEQGRQLPLDEWPQWRVLRGEILAGASAMDARVRTLDGRELWISITGAPVRAADGRATGTVLIARDVTARRALERQLAEQAAELEAIFEAMADGVLVHDAQGRVLRVNQAYRDLMGVEADPDHFARSIDERVRRLRVLNEQGHPIPEEHSVSRRVLSGEVVSGQDAQDVQMHTLDGRAIWVNTSGAPIRTPAGQITGVVLISRDVTVRRQLEQQVRDLADELEAILDASPDVIAVFDQDQHIVRANRALRQTIRGIDFSTFATLSSQARAEQLHLRDAQGRPLPLEDLPDVRALRGELLVDRTSVDVCVLRPNGRELAANVAAAPVYNREGQLTRAVTVWRDTTERRALERQVAEQAAELAAVFAAMTDGVFVLNADGSVSRLNAASHALFGPLPGDGLTNTAEARAQSLDLRDADGRPLRVEQLPTQRLLRGEVLAGDDAVTLQVRTHDGRERTISLTGGPLRDATGQIVGAVGVVRDVTEFQRVQAALAEQERLFRTLVEHSPDIIARFDRGLRYLYVSPAIRQVSPVQEAAYIGKTNAELGWPEAAYASAQRAIERVFQTGQPETLEEIDASDRDPATARHFRAQILPECAADGRVESVLAVTTDITTLKRTEQALREANASLEAARQAEERRKQIAESLRDVLAILNSSQSSREVLQYIVRQVEELLGSTAAVIYGPDQLMNSLSPDAPATTLQVQAAQGLLIGSRRSRPHQRLPFADPAVQQALRSEQPVALLERSGHSLIGGACDESDGNTTIPHLYGELPSPYRALLVVPIRVREGMYGCLLLFYTQPSRFLAEEVALAQAYADQAALAITNARLQGHLEQESAAAERNRLARELHDTVNQEIFSASLIVAGLPTVWQTHRAEAETGLQQLHELIRSALAGLRALLLELRPGQLEQTPLSVALQKLGTAMSTRAGMPIHVDIEGVAGPEPLMPGPVKVACYRVAQEALMNAAKYAKAHAIRIRLRTYGTSRLELEVADDGRGFDPEAARPAGHFGVAMMRERAQAVGASVQVRSRAGQGTMVRMTWRRGRSERP
jgi:PAS domain S-box-containing protein